MGLLDGKVALITGAAGALGSAAARRFGEEGATLVLVDNRPRRLAETCGDLCETYDTTLIGNVDVTIPRSVGKLVEMVLKDKERIDVLLNVVGGYEGPGPVRDTSPEVFDQMMALNAKSVFLMSGAVSPHMIEQGSGKIVNIAASAGLKARRDNSAYAASKAAVLRLTESLAADLKDHGVNVNAVLPSTIDTPANREMMAGADFEKWVTPDALADVLVFLASDMARAIHGAAIPVYGRVKV